MDLYKLKEKYMLEQASYRRSLFLKPELKQLFFELTIKCNEHCWHCGSRCGDIDSKNELSLDEWKGILDEIKSEYDGHLPQINVTGGEPLLYPHFEELMTYAKSLGFRWGMTSNAVLIDRGCAKMLERSGMRTISVSIDGLEDTHDRLRGKKGAYRLAMEGINNLTKLGSFRHIMVTTVVNRESIKELEPLYEIMKDIDIDSWRIIGVEPLGRAKEHPELLMTPKDQRTLMDFIREKRAEEMPVTYGCSHYLGLEYEGTVRDWYFFCMAGLTLASISSKGDVTACLDIERSPSVIQGNVRKRKFTDIWRNEFKTFRYDRSEDDENCRNCESRKYCMGGSCHTWDFENKKQGLCLLNSLR